MICTEQIKTYPENGYELSVWLNIDSSLAIRLLGELRFCSARLPTVVDKPLIFTALVVMRLLGFKAVTEVEKEGEEGQVKVPKTHSSCGNPAAFLKHTLFGWLQMLG